jgi:hypothetical protein
MGVSNELSGFSNIFGSNRSFWVTKSLLFEGLVVQIVVPGPIRKMVC